jgi:Mrp family chromosome partitioning ATPase/uncharacterized protein involved in exopolysaccharide biosynthesis
VEKREPISRKKSSNVFSVESDKESVMVNPETQQASEAGGGLPFEPLTLLIGLLRRWKIVAIFFVVSIALGLFAGIKFGTRIYETETVMLYTPQEGTEQGLGRTPPLATQIQMVKIPSNLEEVRERLQLATSLKALGRACRVWVERKTSLVFIRTTWDSAKEAAAIANTLRDVFIANQMQLAKENAGRDLRDLEARFKKVRSQLLDADGRLQKFITTNKIVDLDMEVKWNLEQVTSLELLLSNARVDRDTLGLQKVSLEERITGLKTKEANEKATQAKTQGLADLNIRIERIRRAIHDDKVQRSGTVDMVKYKLAFERARKLYEKGLISKSEYEETRADFERQEVKALDTEQIKEWKRQLHILEKQVIPEKASFKSEAGEMLHDLQLKALAMELQEVSLRQKVLHLEQERKRIKARLEVLTDLQRKYAGLNREVRARETESKTLDRELTKVRREYQSNRSNFTIISEAKIPLFRLKSNRKIIVIVVVFLINMMGLTLILGLELMDTTVKSAAELTQKFSLPVLGIIPNIKDARGLFPEKSHFPLIEPFRIIARRIRHLVPEKGARLMIVSVNPGEGKTMVAANLAAVLGRQDERVLLLDAQARAQESERSLRYLIAEEEKPIVGLGEYLSFQAESPRDILWSTTLPGVECIPHVNEAVIPDVLASNRMKEMLKALSGDFSIVIMDSPAADQYVDAELVASMSDAILLVVRSRVCSSSGLKRAIERLKETDVPIIGFILNDVDRFYINRL